jgi:alpha-mannosidase
MRILKVAFLLMAALTATAQKQETTGQSKVTDVWLVFKTHFDLGFTDLPQNVFARYRGEMMDNALQIVDENAKLPAGKHFSWTVPGWPLSAQILGPLQTPERKLRVEKAIREGAIAVHAFPFTTHTESLDYEDLVRGLGFSSQIARTYGIPLPISAKMTDVPSHSWVLPTLLGNAGVKFLQLGCNPASQYPRVPPLFWWEGADGSKILCQYTPLYGSEIKPPAGWPCRNYLGMIMTNDNEGPPTQKQLDQILARTAVDLPGVRVHLGTLDDFAKAVLAENPQLPVVKGDMPDTWIQGVLANPKETKIARQVRPLESALDGLNTQMKIWQLPVKSIAAPLARAYEQSLLYAEHTWGMNAEYGPRYSYDDDWKKWMREAEAEPIPLNGDYSKLPNSHAKKTETGSKRKWLNSYDEKRQYILNTEEIVTGELNEHLNLLAKSVDIAGKRVVVYNPLPWVRSGMVEIPWEKGKYFYAKDVPASGFVSFSQKEIGNPKASTDSRPFFETPNFKVVFDLKKGGIASLVEKANGNELIDKTSGYVAGQFLHERFSSNDVDSWFNKYSRIKEGWGLNDLGKPGMAPSILVPYNAFTPDGWKINVTHSKASDIATLTSVNTKGLAKQYTMVFTFPRHAAYVDVEWFVDSKTADKHPEGGWLCFPFAVKDPTFTVGRLGGPIDPAKDIISGTNRYLMAVNSGVSVTAADKSGVALSPVDSPLISLGEPGLWKFDMEHTPRKAAVFVNIYNNMWNTNFPLWQGGSWSEKVRIWGVDKKMETNPDLVRNSWEARLPLLTGVADGPAGQLAGRQIGLSTSRAGALVTAFGENPDGKGIICRFWEQAGLSGDITVSLPEKSVFAKATPVNLRGEVAGTAISVSNGKFSFFLGAYSPASFVLE